MIMILDNNQKSYTTIKRVSCGVFCLEIVLGFVPGSLPRSARGSLCWVRCNRARVHSGVPSRVVPKSVPGSEPGRGGESRGEEKRGESR